MPLLTALAHSIGVPRGIATWLYVGPLGMAGLGRYGQALSPGPPIIIRAAHRRRSRQTFRRTYSGAVVAGRADTARFAGAVLGVPIAAGILVGIGAAILVIGANVPALGSIPSSVYGFACVAGYTLLAGKLGTLLTVSVVDNALINIVVSMVIGALFGFVSEKVGGALAGSSSKAAA